MQTANFGIIYKNPDRKSVESLGWVGYAEFGGCRILATASVEVHSNARAEMNLRIHNRNAIHRHSRTCKLTIDPTSWNPKLPNFVESIELEDTCYTAQAWMASATHGTRIFRLKFSTGNAVISTCSSRRQKRRTVLRRTAGPLNPTLIWS